ncbi:MAG: hypothetical protein CVV05_01490 [Gammaproteobacteria bacterium HGW-Gammaproteobacteria-1]|nr:MAG: hypothetical protein CVV05_01490 [Gammaproteobacteria bacterium HGW-Gammaproteobacteria-1]
MGRVPADLYIQVRDWLVANDLDGPAMYQWASKQTGRPATPQKLAAEIIWIILCAGRSAQAARTIERKVWAAIEVGRPVVEAFGYRAKAAAIERAWHEREADFTALANIPAGDVEALLNWCHSIPFIGDDTQFQLAKNLGADVCKPDIWLCRLAGIPDKPRHPVKERFRTCQALCRQIADATGDRIAVIDSMLWLACNKGVVSVSAEAGPVRFTPPPAAPKARPIMVGV